MNPVYTIGHSNHTTEHFLALLRAHGVTAIADVRSSPRTQINPDFSQPRLSAVLAAAGFRYVFLGDELGARSKDPDCYEKGRVVYSRLARKTFFQSGIDRIEMGAESQTIALLCAERDPLDCHRCILVARQLLQRSLAVHHILADATLETHRATLDRLKRQLHLDTQPTIFHQTPEQLDDLAYEMQEARIAFSIPDEKAQTAWV